ncbi:helix-turn-helix domain-containing protein [Nonlabens dokdonensis]|uniref:helix-turn-helix domain-containing protein n=1 Tax=Nonlabens dokdonensis TaxID=328515 RepID=UPI0026F26055|nr:helix-turn-helix domain-containing protein [Nonlabens dokdonensis]
MKKNIIQLHDITPSEFQEGLIKHLEFRLSEMLKGLDTKTKDKLLTREQTAEMLSISLGTLWSWTRKGILISYRIGNKIMYKQHEVYESLVKINHSKTSLNG